LHALTATAIKRRINEMMLLGMALNLLRKSATILIRDISILYTHVFRVFHNWHTVIARGPTSKINHLTPFGAERAPGIVLPGRLATAKRASPHDLISATA